MIPEHQQIGKKGSIELPKLVQRAGNGEDDMHVIAWQQLRTELLQPLGTAPPLALRTTPMSTRVVPNAGDLSAFTTLDMGS